MSEITSFRDVIALWKSPGAMASEIGATAFQARKWSQRDWIPSEWWVPVLASERVKAAGVTAEKMTELAARRLPARTFKPVPVEALA